MFRVRRTAFHNTKIDEIKVLQKYHETFIHRSFYA